MKMGDERVAEQPKAAGVCKDFYFARFRTPVFTGLSSNACKPQQSMVGWFLCFCEGNGWLILDLGKVAIAKLANLSSPFNH